MPALDVFFPEEEFIKTAKLKEHKLLWAKHFIMELIGVKKINRHWKKIPTKHYDLHTFDEILALYNNSIKLNQNAYNNIPEHGAFITISNHPFGMWDGVSLVQFMAKKRPDMRVLAFQLLNTSPIGKFFIPVDAFKGKEQTQNNLFGTKAALQHLSEGKALGIYPAGEISLYQTKTKKVEDRAWQLSVIKLIQKAKVPVIPIYFHGQNSKTNLLMGRINTMLAKSFLVREFLNRSNYTFKICVGKPISVQEQQDFSNIKEFGLFLREKVNSLKEEKIG